MKLNENYYLLKNFSIESSTCNPMLLNSRSLYCFVSDKVKDNIIFLRKNDEYTLPKYINITVKADIFMNNRKEDFTIFLDIYLYDKSGNLSLSQHMPLYFPDYINDIDIPINEDLKTIVISTKAKCKVSITLYIKEIFDSILAKLIDAKTFLKDFLKVKKY